MKKILLRLIGILGGMTMVVFAQNPALTRLFDLLDDAIQQDPGVTETILGVLNTYESKTTNAAKLSLIVQIRDYVETKMIAGDIPPIPAGFKSLGPDQVTDFLSKIHMQGDASAPLVVMEFLDFQCPYCQKQHANHVLDELREVEFPGKVRTAAVMFPLTGQRHELATQAAESAECAYIQGGSDVYYAHKAGLYANGLKPTMQIIRKVASNIGLDPVRMQACIDEGMATDAVQAQKNIGRYLGVSGTPGSVILDTRNGAYKTVRGAVPIEVFMDIVLEFDKK